MSMERTKRSRYALVSLTVMMAASGGIAKWHPAHKPAAHKPAAHRAVMTHSAARNFTGSVKAAGQLDLSVGRGQMIKLAQPISDVFTSNSSSVDVKANTATELYIFGKERGQSTVYATNAAGQIVYSSNVSVDQNIDSIEEMLRAAMPEDDINVTHVTGSMIVLSGTVLNPEDATQAVELVNGYVGNDPAAKSSSKVNVMVINRLKTATPQQVNLQVRIAEVSKTFAKTIGSSLNALTKGSPGLGVSGASGSNAGTVSNTGTTFLYSKSPGGGTTLALGGSILGGNLLNTLDLAETNGEITTLAQPNLTALSGETASFLAGGEIPLALATPSTTGTTYTVEYKQFGVSLSFTPVVLSDGRISMRVRPEVSELDYSHSITVGTAVIPALTTRRSETTIELGSGQSMVIAGLMKNTINNQKAGTPVVGDVPVLGALFRSSAYQRGETELMIVVTPYLVKPVNTNQIVLPTDAVKAPTDAQRVFLGKNVDGTTGGDRPKPHMAAPVTSVNPAVGALEAQPAGPAPKAPPVSDQVGQFAAPPQPTAQPAKSKSSNADATPGFGS